MTNTTTTVPGGYVDPNDPYFYGFRTVKRVDATGKEVWASIPLTREDALHPQEGDHVTQNTEHDGAGRYLTDVCAARLAHLPDALVCHDVLVDGGVPGLRAKAPDVTVLLGVRAGTRPIWGTIPVAQEGARVALAIEVTSPATVEDDLTTKALQYAAEGVEQYLVVDMVARGQPGPAWRLLDHHLVDGAYVAREPDARGWVRLEAVGIWLGIVDGRPVCFDDDGRPIGDYTAQAARAEAEAARADAAEARVQAQEEELRRLRGSRSGAGA